MNCILKERLDLLFVKAVVRFSAVHPELAGVQSMKLTTVSVEELSQLLMVFWAILSFVSGSAPSIMDQEEVAELSLKLGISQGDNSL